MILSRQFLNFLLKLGTPPNCGAEESFWVAVAWPIPSIGLAKPHISRERKAVSRAVIEALNLAQGIEGVEAVTIYTDSQLVQRQITGRWKVKQPHLVPLLREYQAVVSACPFPVAVEWIPGCENPAHEVANEYLTPDVTGVVTGGRD